MTTYDPHLPLASDDSPLPPSVAPRPLPQEPDGPGIARSAAPVAASIVLLFGLAVGMAFAGRAVIGWLAALLGG